MTRSIMIAVIVGVVVLGAGALFLMQNRITPQSQPSPSVQEQKFTPLFVTVNLTTQNNSGEEGTAILTALENGKTKVVFKLTGAPADIVQPAHIHNGSCANLGGVLYPLTPPINGESETALDVNLTEDILKKLPLAVNVHKSSGEANVYYACGDIKNSVSGSGETPVPSGSGQANPDRSPSASPSVNNNRDGGPLQTSDDKRRGADKPED